MLTADTALQAVLRLPDCTQTRADLRSGLERVRTTEIVRSASFTPEGVVLACGDRVLAADDELRELWHYEPPRMLVFIVASPTAALSVEDGVLAAFNSGWVGRFDSQGRPLKRWRDHEAPRTMGRLEDGGFAGTDGFRVFVRDPHSWMKVMDHRPDERVYGLAVPARGHLLALRTVEDVRLVHARTGEEVLRRRAPEGLPLLAWSPDSKTLAVGGVHGVELLDTAGEPVGRVHEDRHLTSLAFHPDGRLVTGWGDGAVRFYR